MAKVTSKLQVTIPKAIAVAHNIEPGAELEFESAGDVIRVRPKRRKRPSAADANDRRARLASFDEATRRQARRDTKLRREHPTLFETTDRGWQREELYGGRGVPR